jgi:hypothetical protein
MQEDDEKVSSKKIVFDLDAWTSISLGYTVSYPKVRNYGIPRDIRRMSSMMPEYVFAGLKPDEIENEWMHAGKTEFLNFDKKIDIQKIKSWIVCPFTKTMARCNGFLWLDEVLVIKAEEEKTWRLTELGKGSGNYCDFKSLENARAVYWDIVRAVLNWGTKQRKRDFGFITMINTSGIDLKVGDVITWCLPGDICE